MLRSPGYAENICIQNVFLNLRVNTVESKVEARKGYVVKAILGTLVNLLRRQFSHTNFYSTIRIKEDAN